MIFREEPDFVNLPEPLAGLFAAAGEGSFFATPAWYDLMSREAREAGARLHLFADDDASAALVCRTDGEKRLHSLSNAYSVEHGAIVRPGESRGSRALIGLAAAIADAGPPWELIRLAGFDPADPGYSAVRDGFRAARWLVRPFFDSGTWYEDTRGLDFRRYFDARPTVLKNTYRRKAKSGETKKLDWRFSDSGCDIEELIADYETVYRNSWKESERFRNFIPALIRLAFARGALRMGVIRIDGVPAAAQFWIIWRGRAVIYKLAHDERFKSLSPGTLLTMRMVERVLECDRPVEINFGRGDDPYKRLWLPQRRERWGILAANPRTLRGLALGVRAMAGRARDAVTASLARRHEAERTAN